MSHQCRAFFLIFVCCHWASAENILAYSKEEEEKIFTDAVLLRGCDGIFLSQSKPMVDQLGWHRTLIEGAPHFRSAYRCIIVQ